MDLGDIIFRGALILAVVMLAGVFAYNLGLDDKNDNEELSKIADSLSEMLYTISTWEDGSSAVIRFGDTGSGPMSLPGDINNEPFSVEVLPGMVVLVSGGRSEVSMEDISIVPSCPPEGPGTLNRSVTRMIGTTSGGYTIRAPCRIHVSVREHADGRSLFIHPEDQELSDTAKDLKEDVLKLCDESGQVVDGWKREVVISTDLVDASGRMLLFKNDQGELEEGCVRTPVLLPNDTDTTLMDAEDDHLTFRKNADLQEDGTYLIRTSIFPT